MMELASGMADAMRVSDGFASDAEAAAYWAEDTALVPTEERTYPGALGQDQRARLYRGGSDGPLILYIHGGGWTGGSIDLNERACQLLADRAGVDIVSISYRLAPERPYPAGLDDCRAALHHFRDQFAARPIVLTGASAGANLALALALDEPIAGLILFYGVFGSDMETTSYREFAEGYGFTRQRMAELFDLYDPEGRRGTEPRLCPLHASDIQVSALPPTYILAAECDVLRDDSVALARRLATAGREHQLHIEPGVTHGFINRGRLVPAADRCLAQAAAFLNTIEIEENAE